jgi:hypothetical protein
VAVESENFEQQPPSGQDASAARAPRRFAFPADYYSTPPGDRPPLFAPWATTGCGAAAVVILAGAFSAGYVFSHGGSTSLMSWTFSELRTDIVTMYAKDVTARQKAGLDVEMTSLQKNLAAKRIPLEKLQPVLGDLRDAMLDDVVSSAETNKLIAAFRAANATAGALPHK